MAVNKRKIQMAPMFLPVDDSQPFKGLLISDGWKMFEKTDGRTICRVCKKSRKYFCYTCYIPVHGLEKYVPKVKLPIKVDIIKHPREKSGKSTSPHAAMLAPEDVTIYTYPNIPDYDKQENVVLIYPGENALSIEEMYEKFKKNSEKSSSGGVKCHDSEKDTCITRAVFIDSTWNQSHFIYKDSRIKALPCLVLTKRISQFWRHQIGSPRWYLSTIEAIHQFLIELVNIVRSKNWKQNNTNFESTESTTSFENITSGIVDCAVDTRGMENGKKNIISKEETVETERQFYRGEFDNLLFFFVFMYHKIHTLYNHDDLLSYKRPYNKIVTNVDLSY